MKNDFVHIFTFEKIKKRNFPVSGEKPKIGKIFFFTKNRLFLKKYTFHKSCHMCYFLTKIIKLKLVTPILSITFIFLNVVASITFLNKNTNFLLVVTYIKSIPINNKLQKTKLVKVYQSTTFDYILKKIIYI